tara:strand:- start:2660 stop:3073 length:414 start_codon:yes stop_codon:yes gene_type:complete
MATSKIASITKTENTWQGQSGTMYDYEVSLEDNTTGIASSTSAEAPPYVEGDEVEYTKTENKFGVKLRIKKAGAFTSGGSGGGYSQNPETQKRIENSWALNCAVNIIGTCASDVSYTEYLEQAGELAKVLIQKRDLI